MRPRTKLHFEVLDLRKYLNDRKEHEAYAINQHDFYYTNHYKNLICLECNHQWKPNQIWHEEVIGVECPSCKKKLQKIQTENGGLACKILTYSIAEVIDRFQIVRYFSCWKQMSKRKKPSYLFRNLFEEWKDWDKNKRVIIGRTMGWYGDGFNSTNYEIRNPSQRVYSNNTYDGFASDLNCPMPTFLPRFHKYQLTSYDHHCDWRHLIHKLEFSSQVETLLKSKQKELLYYAVHKYSKHDTYWASIKIAIRNNYFVQDPGIWYDYLDLLRFFGKDLHSPKYVCPEDLFKAHDYWMKKKEKVDEINRIEEERLSLIRRQQRIENLEREYIERCSKFFDLEFKSGDISISVLKSVEEFKQEAEALQHCVYTNEYYAKSNSLIFSAKVQGVRTETIEVKLKSMTIEQSRGLKNNPSVYHKEIVQLLKRNIGKIKACMKSKKSSLKIAV